MRPAAARAAHASRRQIPDRVFRKAGTGFSSGSHAAGIGRIREDARKDRLERFPLVWEPP